MAAQLIRIKAKSQKLRKDQAAELRYALKPFHQEFPELVADLLKHIDRKTASESRWTFVMIAPEQNKAVVRYLSDYSQRPLIAVNLWALLFENMNIETGEIHLTRDEIAAHLNVQPKHISEIMTELSNCCAILRRREKVPGMRGQGRVRYFMNPNVATNLSGKERDEAQRNVPQVFGKLSVLKNEK
jgi:hypothetical protein